MRVWLIVTSKDLGTCSMHYIPWVRLWLIVTCKWTTALQSETKTQFTNLHYQTSRIYVYAFHYIYSFEPELLFVLTKYSRNCHYWVISKASHYLKVRKFKETQNVHVSLLCTLGSIANKTYARYSLKLLECNVQICKMLWKWLKIGEIEVCWSCQNRSTIWKIRVRFLDQNWHFPFVKNRSTIWQNRSTISRRKIKIKHIFMSLIWF